MIKRNYKVRCKRCGIPYNPVNVSRIRTCIFCRKSPITARSERLDILTNHIQRFYETQHSFPTSAIVRKWIGLKFDVRDSTIDSYFKELEKHNLIEFVKDNYVEQIKLLNIVKQPINA